MAPNLLPTLLWFIVAASGVGLLVDAAWHREGARRIIQVGVGALLVLAFMANAWAGFSHYAECEEDPWHDSCDQDDDE